MAKISANGKHEQARWRVTLDEGYESPGGVMDHSVEYLYVLRSDGVLLVRTSKIEGEAVRSTFRVQGRIKATTPVDDREGKVEAYLTKRYGKAWKWESPR